MANLDLVASLKEVELYLIKLGYKAETIAHFFSEMSFKEGFIQPLTATNIIHNNRKAGEAKGKTYHIAITGSSMQLFYDKDYLQNLEESTEDKTVYFKMLECNIKDLYTLKTETEEQAVNTAVSQNLHHLKVLTTHSVTKISKRKKQTPQVQLSKVTKDGELFTEWRSYLYTNDKIICLKSKQDEYFLLGIPVRETTPIYEGLTIVTKANTKEYLAKSGLIGQKVVLKNKREQDKELIEAVTDIYESYKTNRSIVYAYQGVYAIVSHDNIKLIMTVTHNIERSLLTSYGAMQYLYYQLCKNEDIQCEKMVKTKCEIPKELLGFLSSEGIAIIKN